MVRFVLLAAFGLVAGPAFAHPEAGVVGGLASGFLHPLSGLDHLVAMVAVGLWAAQLGRPGVWLLPLSFMGVMALGGVAGALGLALPMAEVAIAGSAVVLGVCVALAVRVPAAAAAAVVAGFALFHGFAHGSEMPGASDAVAYGLGFVAATGLLHSAGVGAGVLARGPVGARAVRAVGAGIAGLGAVFLLSLA